MKIGYARVSTADQTAGLDAQLRDLDAVGCEKVFAERIGATAARRPQLEAALDFAREGAGFTHEIATVDQPASKDAF